MAGSSTRQTADRVTSPSSTSRAARSRSASPRAAAPGASSSPRFRAEPAMTWLLTVLLAAQSITTPGISGVVRDTTGQVVAGATVIARFVSGAEQQAVSGSDGRYT